MSRSLIMAVQSRERTLERPGAGKPLKSGGDAWQAKNEVRLDDLSPVKRGGRTGAVPRCWVCQCQASCGSRLGPKHRKSQGRTSDLDSRSRGGDTPWHSRGKGSSLAGFAQQGLHVCVRHTDADAFHVGLADYPTAISVGNEASQGPGPDDQPEQEQAELETPAEGTLDGQDSRAMEELTSRRIRAGPPLLSV